MCHLFTTKVLDHTLAIPSKGFHGVYDTNTTVQQDSLFEVWTIDSFLAKEKIPREGILNRQLD
jgi:hypothetical protein